MISCRPRKEAQAFTRLWRKFERKGCVLDSEVVCIFCPGHIDEHVESSGGRGKRAMLDVVAKCCQRVFRDGS